MDGDLAAFLGLVLIALFCWTVSTCSDAYVKAHQPVIVQPDGGSR